MAECFWNRTTLTCFPATAHDARTQSRCALYFAAIVLSTSNNLYLIYTSSGRSGNSCWARVAALGEPDGLLNRKAQRRFERAEAPGLDTLVQLEAVVHLDGEDLLECRL